MADRDVRFRISADDRATPAFDRINRELDEMQSGVRAAAKAMDGLSGPRRRVAEQSQKLVDNLSDGLKKSAETAEATYDALVDKLKRADAEIARARQSAAERAVGLKALKAQEDAALQTVQRLDAAVKSDGLDARMSAAKKAMADVDAQIRSATRELTSLQKAMKPGGALERERDNAMQAREKAMATAQARAQKAQRDLAETQVDRAVIGGQIPKVRKAIADLQKATQTDSSRAALQQARADLRALTAAESAAERKVRSLSADLAPGGRIGKAMAAADSDARIRAASDRMAQAQVRVVDLSLQRRQLDAQATAARQTISDLEGAIQGDASRKSLVASKAELKAIQSALAKVQAEEKRLSASLAAGGRLVTARASAENEVNAAGLAMRSVRQIAKIESPDQVRGSAAMLPPDAGQRVGGWERLNRAVLAAATSTRGATDASRGARAALGGLQNQLSQIIGVWTLYTVAVNQTAAAIEAYRTKQRFESRMSYPAKGDMKVVGQELDYVTKKSDEFGLSLQDTLEDYSKFATAAQSSGLSQGDTRKIFEGLASVSTVYKLDSESFKRSLNAIQQMISKGAIQAEELKTQLGDALPSAATIFARALGYGEDRMQAFFKDMEAGKFGVNELKKVAAYMTGEFSGSVAKAANSFEGQLNRFKSAMFNARMAIADGGLIEGVTDAMEELTEFFKSDEGKRFFIELGRGANLALDALVMLAKNLDLIIKGALVFGAARLVGFTAGLFAFKKGATTAATAVNLLSGILKGFLTIFGGWAGAAVVAGAVLWQMFSPDTVQPQVEAQKRLEAIRGVLGDIRQAAAEAGGDVGKFAEALKKIPELTGAQGRTLVRDANQARAEEAQKLRDMAMQSVNERTGRTDVSSRLRSLIGEFTGRGGAADTIALTEAERKLLSLIDAYNTGKIKLAQFNAELDGMAKAGQISDKVAASYQEQASVVDVLKDQTDDLRAGVKAANGSLEDQEALLKKATAATNDAAAAAAEAARKQKVFEDAMRALTKEAGEADAKLKLQDRLKEIGAQADAARKALDDLKASLDPAEFERRGAAIAAAMTENIGAARAEFLKADAAARGFNYSLGPGAAQALAERDAQNIISGPVNVALGAANFGNKILAPSKELQDRVKPRLNGGAAARADSLSHSHPALLEGFLKLVESAPAHIKSGIGISSAYRNYEVQRGIFNKSDKTGKWAAAPGKSNHNFGLAFDLTYKGQPIKPGRVPQEVLDWLSRSVGAAGLKRPMSYEEWHVEPAGDRAALRRGREALALPKAQREAAMNGASFVAAGTVPTATAARQTIDTNLTVVNALAKGFSEAAMDKLQQFAISNPEAMNSNAAVLAMADGNAKALADIMRQAGKPEIAASFEALTVGDRAVKGAEAVVKARDDAAEAAKKEAEEAKRIAEAERDALLSVEQRQALSKLEGEAQEQARLGFELDNMERQNGRPLGQAYRADYMAKGLDAWRNENREQLERDRQKATDAEIKRLSDAVQALQKKKEGLERDLQWAVQDRDFGKQNALKAEIAGVNAELLKAVQSAEDFNAKLGGEEAQKRIEDMRNLRAETERNDYATRDYASTMQSLGDLITGHMVSAFDSFAQKVAEGENPWRALVGAVGQAVGQILIDIGRMIVQAMVAKAVMSMLGLAMPAGSMGAGIMGNIFSGAPPLPVRHAGGAAEGSGRTRSFWSALGNLARDEHMAILQTGEEVLTRSDPRHSLNMGLAIQRMQRFHDGGIVGGQVVAAAASAPAASQKAIGGMASRGGDQPVAIHNHLDAESMLASALATPAGQRVVLNVLSANPKKFRAALGGA